MSEDIKRWVRVHSATLPTASLFPGGTRVAAKRHGSYREAKLSSKCHWLTFALVLFYLPCSQFHQASSLCLCHGWQISSYAHGAFSKCGSLGCCSVVDSEAFWPTLRPKEPRVKQQSLWLPLRQLHVFQPSPVQMEQDVINPYQDLKVQWLLSWEQIIPHHHIGDNWVCTSLLVLEGWEAKRGHGWNPSGTCFLLQSCPLKPGKSPQKPHPLTL